MASIPQQATYGVYHLISDFLAERLKAYKNWQKRSLILQYNFIKKTSLILRTSPLSTLQKIYFRSTAKNPFTL